MAGVPGSGNDGGSGYSQGPSNYPYPDATTRNNDALVRNEPQRGRHVLTIRDDMLLVYRVARGRENGAAP